ncbi:MAG: 5-(carboxyamino)imidazole ribonucleotide mutase [Candidatus Omnitrophica bacterium]|nr:5-(carboxyamino)imidazole ribonucleotide mutase [Candidatus Omnitrophota bacterium]
MAKAIVSIIMGSSSDTQVLKETEIILERFSVPFEKRVLSAHRSPEDLVEYVKKAQDKGTKIIIAGAGGAAALAGVVAAHTVLPVIGIPMETNSLKGLDSLLSTVQMPSGVPVATMAVGKAGAKNAAILTLQILAITDKKLQRKLAAYKKELVDTVRIQNKKFKNKK